MQEGFVIKKAISSIKITFIAQVLVLILSLVRSLVLPKLLSVEDYGYWQVYVFYSAYVGMFALGYNDGVYLKYGKYQYDELPFERLRSSNIIYVLMLGAFTVIACGGSFFIHDTFRKLAMIGVSLDIFLMGINGLLVYVLQITNQMKAYSVYSVLDKVVLLLEILLIMFLPTRTFVWVVLADVISKLVVTVCLLWRFRSFFGGKRVPLKEGKCDFCDNVKIGLNLMIANLMGMFVTGIGRFVVDAFGSIEDYAYYSFGITVTNLVLVFITAVSLVLYPTLKRLPVSNYNGYFKKLNCFVTAFNFLALLLYYPAIWFIRFFLPGYISIFAYLHFLFGVIILQSKMQLLNNTFYKVLREEKSLMRSNMICVLIFLILALVSYYFTKSVTAIAVSTFVAMLYRCYVSEAYLRKKLGIEVPKSMYIEIVYIIGYIISIICLNDILSLLVCVLMFVAWCVYSIPNFKCIGDLLRKR